MAVHLVRHAHAGERTDSLEDESRPLSDRGHTQAQAVDKELSAWPIARILTSRYLRCLQTVTPVADRLGLTVTVDSALAEEAEVTATWALLERLLGEPGDSVVCSHGNVLSAILDRVHRRGAETVADEWSCRKGSVWRLETAADGSVDRAVLSVLGGRS